MFYLLASLYTPSCNGASHRHKAERQYRKYFFLGGDILPYKKSNIGAKLHIFASGVAIISRP
jgi:hypothetical protein